MKKILFALLLLSATACNDSHDVLNLPGPYMGPQGSPEPGYPHHVEDEDGYRKEWAKLKKSARELLRRQCGY